MQLVKVRKLKSFLYEYESIQEKIEHRKVMLQAMFQIEKENYLSIEYSQTIIEIE